MPRNATDKPDVEIAAERRALIGEVTTAQRRVIDEIIKDVVTIVRALRRARCGGVSASRILSVVRQVILDDPSPSFAIIPDLTPRLQALQMSDTELLQAMTIPCDHEWLPIISAEVVQVIEQRLAAAHGTEAREAGAP